MAMWGVSSPPSDSNVFPFSFHPGFVSHYGWFHTHMCEHCVCTSNIHPLLLQTGICIHWLLLGSSDVDQKNDSRKESSTGLGSTLEILECWVVECGLEVGRAGKWWVGTLDPMNSLSNGKGRDAARDGTEQSLLTGHPELGPFCSTSGFPPLLLVSSENVCVL